ncbi:unnamed protein product [Rotaria sordida]|uniref:F-box domain-containing protein n=1 Tax=Rotaria sordida TaxID=392033 RepID=A0A814AZA3_9BILA|nr:unnamed protein product [Rotaria sordida]CAF4108692.1 unnamed protein product [Rotaria sordida]
MNNNKRKSTFNYSYYQDIKKSNIDQQIMSIDNLSNEIFYEIFDYLDACEIYHAFSNLNHRFQQLLYSSSLLFKIELHYRTPKEIFLNNFKSLIRFHQHQIISIHLTYSINVNTIISSMIRNSLFNHLESIRLHGVSPNILSRFLKKCISLPRLFLLRIDTSNSLKDLNNIYKLVFNLPKLKSLEITAHGFNKFNIKTSLSMATAKQFSPIKSLMIDHSCTFKECSTIISYTPQLRNLSVSHLLMDDNPKKGIHLPMILSNLTYLFICEYDLDFDQFEMFIRKIDAKLQFLSFNTESEDINYLDAKRWEKLIMKYLPQLDKFYFQYHIYRDYENEYPVYRDQCDQFISSFWIDRQWLFNADIDYGFILYSIQPYEKQWYEYDSPQGMVNSSTDLSKCSQLSIRSIPGEYFDLFLTDVTRVLNMAEIYHLEITEENVFSGILVEIVDLLAQLRSLKIHSLSLRVPEGLCVEKFDVFDLLEIPIQITKVYLEKMNEIEEIYFLMTLCPDLTYLKVDSINNMDIELFFRNILMKIPSKYNEHFRSMCIRIPTADDKMINKLEKMINVEKLLINYKIQRISECIYLQWN